MFRLNKIVLRMFIIMPSLAYLVLVISKESRVMTVGGGETRVKRTEVPFKTLNCPEKQREYYDGRSEYTDNPNINCKQIICANKNTCTNKTHSDGLRIKYDLQHRLIYYLKYAFQFIQIINKKSFHFDLSRV